MKIIIIRHDKVDMEWDKKYNSSSFDAACQRYNISNIIKSCEKKQYENNKNKIYISGLSRTYETACELFGKGDFYKTELINEVPLVSFKDTEKNHSLVLWSVIGRIQWLLNNKRQTETRKDTVIRANKAIDLIEKNKDDCFVITHGFFMKTFIKELKKRGYKIEQKRKIKIENLDKIIAFK